MSAVHFVGDDPVLEAHVRRLPCGLDAVVHPDPSVPLVHVSVWYRVGSTDEELGTSGFAHLYEHLFKNSLHLGGRHHYEVLRRAGALSANASTAGDRTAYHETVPADQLDLALWLESDRMGYFLPALDDNRLAAQKAVVRSERRQRYENAPYGADRFAVAEALWPEGHPHRYLTIGRHQDIEAATLEQVERFYRTWYVPANATLVIAGDVDVTGAMAAVERWFGSFPASARPPRPVWSLPRRAPGRTVVEDRFAALARIHRAWLGPPVAHDGELELELLAAILGQPGTGALWRRLVYEQPLAQRVQTWYQATRLGGEWHVAVDLRTGADAAAVRGILDEELARAAAEPLDARALVRAQTRREAAVLWRLEGLDRRAALIQRSMLYQHRPDGLAEELERWRAVTCEAMRAAAATWLGVEAMIEVETVALRAAGRPTAPETPVGDEIA